MTSIVWKIFEFFDEWDKRGDPRVREWFLMQSPLKPLLIALFYLYFVQKLGPEIMKNRAPLQIDKILILYNFVQVVVGGFIVKEACRLLWFRGGYNFTCIDIDYSPDLGKEQARVVWIYFMLKVLDLLDTVFFVLRKKQSQVTFLHVYHHTLVFTFGWVVTKYYPGGHVAFFGTINTFVHMIMYTYYLLAALHVAPEKMKKWKKYVTQLQLIQFVVTGIHASLGLLVKECNFPKFLIAIGIPQDIFMFTLFWDFYKKTYWREVNDKTIFSTKSVGDLKKD